MVKYKIVSEVYATHDVVINNSEPIKTFKTLTEARAYSVNKAPRTSSWWILKENERTTVIVGEIWTKWTKTKRDGVVRKTIYLSHIKGDYGKKYSVNRNGTLGKDIKG